MDYEKLEKKFKETRRKRKYRRNLTDEQKKIIRGRDKIYRRRKRAEENEQEHLHRKQQMRKYKRKTELQMTSEEYEQKKLKNKKKVQKHIKNIPLQTNLAHNLKRVHKHRYPNGKKKRKYISYEKNEKMKNQRKKFLNEKVNEILQKLQNREYRFRNAKIFHQSNGNEKSTKYLNKILKKCKSDVDLTNEEIKQFPKLYCELNKCKITQFLKELETKFPTSYGQQRLPPDFDAF